MERGRRDALVIQANNDQFRRPLVLAVSSRRPWRSLHSTGENGAKSQSSKSRSSGPMPRLLRNRA